MLIARVAWGSLTAVSANFTICLKIEQSCKNPLLPLRLRVKH